MTSAPASNTVARRALKAATGALLPVGSDGALVAPASSSPSTKTGALLTQEELAAEQAAASGPRRGRFAAAPRVGEVWGGAAAAAQPAAPAAGAATTMPAYSQPSSAMATAQAAIQALAATNPAEAAALQAQLQAATAGAGSTAVSGAGPAAGSQYAPFNPAATSAQAAQAAVAAAGGATAAGGGPLATAGLVQTAAGGFAPATTTAGSASAAMPTTLPGQRLVTAFRRFRTALDGSDDVQLNAFAQQQSGAGGGGVADDGRPHILRTAIQDLRAAFADTQATTPAAGTGGAAAVPKTAEEQVAEAVAAKLEAAAANSEAAAAGTAAGVAVADAGVAAIDGAAAAVDSAAAAGATAAAAAKPAPAPPKKGGGAAPPAPAAADLNGILAEGGSSSSSASAPAAPAPAVAEPIDPARNIFLKTGGSGGADNLIPAGKVEGKDMLPSGYITVPAGQPLPPGYRLAPPKFQTGPLVKSKNGGYTLPPGVKPRGGTAAGSLPVLGGDSPVQAAADGAAAVPSLADLADPTAQAAADGSGDPAATPALASSAPPMVVGPDGQLQVLNPDGTSSPAPPGTAPLPGMAAPGAPSTPADPANPYDMSGGVAAKEPAGAGGRRRGAADATPADPVAAAQTKSAVGTVLDKLFGAGAAVTAPGAGAAAGVPADEAASSEPILVDENDQPIQRGPSVTTGAGGGGAAAVKPASSANPTTTAIKLSAAIVGTLLGLGLLIGLATWCCCASAGRRRARAARDRDLLLAAAAAGAGGSGVSSSAGDEEEAVEAEEKKAGAAGAPRLAVNASAEAVRWWANPAAAGPPGSPDRWPRVGAEYGIPTARPGGAYSPGRHAAAPGGAPSHYATRGPGGSYAAAAPPPSCVPQPQHQAQHAPTHYPAYGSTSPHRPAPVRTAGGAAGGNGASSPTPPRWFADVAGGGGPPGPSAPPAPGGPRSHHNAGTATSPDARWAAAGRAAAPGGAFGMPRSRSPSPDRRSVHPGPPPNVAMPPHPFAGGRHGRGAGGVGMGAGAASSAGPASHPVYTATGAPFAMPASFRAGGGHPSAGVTGASVYGGAAPPPPPVATSSHHHHSRSGAGDDGSVPSASHHHAAAAGTSGRPTRVARSPRHAHGHAAPSVPLLGGSYVVYCDESTQTSPNTEAANAAAAAAAAGGCNAPVYAPVYECSAPAPPPPPARTASDPSPRRRAASSRRAAAAAEAAAAAAAAARLEADGLGGLTAEDVRRLEARIRARFSSVVD